MKVLGGLLLFLMSSYVHASTGSGTTAGAFLTGMANDTGVRERIELIPSGDLLIGRPTRSSVALLSVYAPGSKSGHVILRELQLLDGRKKSLLLTAPSPLGSQIRRVTIYVRHPSKDLVLFEPVGAVWEQREPHRIHVTVGEDESATTQDLLAFSPNGLGHYWLLDSTMIGLQSPFLPNPSARELLGGSMNRAVLPWTWSLVLLVASWVASLWIHNRQRQGEQ